ncbi:MAG TPA: hypothetical protein VLP43_11695 [Solirubrobacteraceae bacterium]|nr:hypothetical protein [Solirubrobacteraceae bacterium]
MDRVSRPLLGLLVSTLAFFALWVTMLKPSSPTNGANSAKNPGLGQLGGAITAAHGAVANSNRASVRSGGTVVASSPTHPAVAPPRTIRVPAKRVPVTRPAVRAHEGVHRAVHARTHGARRAQVIRAAAHLTPARRLALVTRSLSAHRVLALLFFNPAAADDRAVNRELTAVPVHHGAVVKLAIPLAEVASYATLTAQAPISTSPTLLMVNRAGGAVELVGFADRFEIAQRVADALAVR